MALATVVLFDIDGTLVTCGGAGRMAMEAAFLELSGRSGPPAACSVSAVFDFPFGGATDRGIARRALANGGYEPDDARIDAFLELYLAHLPRLLERSERYAVLPGVVALLEALEETELAIGLGTGNVERGARVKLARGGLNRRFSFGGFGCDHEERARLLERGAQRGAERLGRPRDSVRVVVVGDTPRDIEAAHAIGAECVAVATGSHGVDLLRACRPALAVEDLRDPRALGAIAGA